MCSFQCLEHNPLEQLDDLIAHMVRFTNRYFYVSLPYSGGWCFFSFNLRGPKFHLATNRCFSFDFLGAGRIDPTPFYLRPPERIHSPHWWEVGRPGAGKKAIIKKFQRHGLTLTESFHNVFFPHHVFFAFETGK